MATPRPYGSGSYGTLAYGTSGATELGGISQIAFNAQGDMIRTWQQPSHVCEPGAWTITTLPTGPQNELEIVA